MTATLTNSEALKVARALAADDFVRLADSAAGYGRTQASARYRRIAQLLRKGRRDSNQLVQRFYASMTGTGAAA